MQKKLEKLFLPDETGGYWKNQVKDIHFATALEQTVNIVVNGEFEVVLEINKGRNIIYNYWWRPTIYHDFWHGTNWCVTTKWSRKTLYPKLSQRNRPLSGVTHTTATNQATNWSRYVRGRDRRLLRPVRTKSATRRVHKRYEWILPAVVVQRSYSPDPISTVCGQYCVAFISNFWCVV